MAEHFDILIIGTGGGTKLRPAADLGYKVAIVEKDQLGGTCLNRGCIPSKMLIYPSELLEQREHMAKYGIDVPQEFSVRWKDLVGRTTETVAADSASVEVAYGKKENLTYIHGHASFVGPKEVEVAGKRLTADKIYIATGSRPNIPRIPGLEGTPHWTSTNALRSESQPKHLIVIGGGYIATELGGFYQRMGTKVTYIVRSGMINAEDMTIRGLFEEHISRVSDVYLGTKTTAVSHKDGMFTVLGEGADGMTCEVSGDALLVATGVRPNSDQLGLENTGVTTDKRGFIEVNEFMETKEQGVYALGDVVGTYLFRHSVNFEGEYLFGQHFGDAKPAKINYPPMPHAMFTVPEIAGVGKTEDELVQQGCIEGDEYICVEQAYKDSAMGMAMLPEHGLVKLLVDPNSGQLLGAHILGEKAADMIHYFILAMTHKLSVEQMLAMIFVHPALSEVLRNALRKAKKRLDELQ